MIKNLARHNHNDLHYVLQNKKKRAIL